MSIKFAAWLRVTPRPTTLAESSAIYQALSKQGRISVFTKASKSVTERLVDKTNPSSLYYAVFPHEPPTLRTIFDVPVYHGLPSARDEDPFHIRGLQSRKPMPAPKTFKCVIERVEQNDAKDQERQMIEESPFYGHFKVQKNSWLQEVLVETGAPPGIEKGIGISGKGSDQDMSIEGIAVKRGLVAGPGSKINMGSVLEMWRGADTSSGMDKTRQMRTNHSQTKVTDR